MFKINPCYVNIDRRVYFDVQELPFAILYRLILSLIFSY